MVTLVVFFMSTLLWQALKVYTTFWLRKWTDDDDTADVCEPLKILSISFYPFLSFYASHSFYHNCYPTTAMSKKNFLAKRINFSFTI